MLALTVTQSEEKNKKEDAADSFTLYSTSTFFSLFSVSNYVMQKSQQRTQGIAEAPHLIAKLIDGLAIQRCLMLACCRGYQLSYHINNLELVKYAEKSHF